jgi:amino acid transporter
VDRAIWILALGGVTLAINWYGLRMTARVNLVSVWGQLAVVFLLIVCAGAALHAGEGSGAITWRPLYGAASFNLAGLFAATSICVMSFLGFDAVSTLSEEVAGDNRRVVGRAILTVFFLSAALFVVMAWVLGDLLHGFVFRDPAEVIYDVSAVSIGKWMSVLLAWTTATLVGFTNALPMQVGVARVLYAMGRDRQLPAILSRVHPVHGTPYVGMIVTTLLSISVALSMRNLMDQLVSVVNFGALSGFLLLHCSVIVLFVVKGGSRRYGLHLVGPAIGIGVVLAILSGMSVLAKFLGAAWLAVGIGYGACLARRRRAELAL